MSRNARSRNAWRALCVVCGFFSWSLASSFVGTQIAPMARTQAAQASRSRRMLRHAVPELLSLAESAEDEALDTEVVAAVGCAATHEA
eukprot:s401_g13.t1